jgi:FtsP/CotA-like multicopper oxidase with cupredoxin domain
VGKSGEGKRLLRRRDVLQLGAASVAAIGAGGVSLAGRSAQPGSGQGPQPPKPPMSDDVVDTSRLPVENWSEPWVWRPSEWPGQALTLHLVGNAHAPRATSPGNPYTPLYSYNGSSPAPTVRMRGDETLRVKLRNFLGPNMSQVPVGPAADPFELVPEKLVPAICQMFKNEGQECDLEKNPPTARLLFGHFHEFFEHIPVELVDTACVSDAVNVPHGSHTTNLHTHGLHVEPGVNPNGTQADNTYLRVLPRADWETRQRAESPSCRTLASHERVAEADFEHVLGDVERASRVRSGRAPRPHPPGTHWYHPHSHGATHDQVASGLAGFLVVEGDVDDAINLAMTGVERPDPTVKTGRFDYRERLIMIQRVEVSSLDVDAGPRHNQGRLAPPTAVNGTFTPMTMFMRPGAVERWRVLNGSVDGGGGKSFMVLDGQFVFHDGQL